jgi:hypothetical protein
MKIRLSPRLDVNHPGKLFKFRRKNMKTLIRLFLIFGAILISSPSFAFTDLCNLGNEVLSQTTAQTNEYFQENLSNRRVGGKGTVYDVEEVAGGFNKECFVTVRCGDAVFVEVLTKCIGSVGDLKVGQPISFTGTCIDFEKAYYQNSDKRHVNFKIDKPVLRY